MSSILTGGSIEVALKWQISQISAKIPCIMFKDPRSRTRKKSNKYALKTYVHPGMSEAELQAHLKKTVIALVSIIIFLIALFTFLGPTIGSFFGLVSKHRNDTGLTDNIKPPAPIFSNVPEATKNKNISLSGIAEPGSTITIYLNGPEKDKVTADKEGRFAISNLALIEGKNTLYAKSFDQKGNESEKSQTHIILRDTKNPEIKILQPQNGSKVENLVGRITVKGEVNEKATVTVNNRKAIVKSDNTFELQLGVEEGNVEIKITAVDQAGNEKTETIYVTYAKN